MASRFMSKSDEMDSSKGRFFIAQASDGWISVKYKYSADRMGLAEYYNVSDLVPPDGTEILKINQDKDILTIFPLMTFPDRDDFLKPKYNRILAISLEGFSFENPQTHEDINDILESLPLGFIKDPEYGLGLQKEFRFIIHAIKNIEAINKLVITNLRSSTSIESDTYILDYRDFEAVRKSINRIHNEAVSAALKDKIILSHNALLTLLLPEKYPEKQRPYKQDTIFKAVLGASNVSSNISIKDKDATIKLLSDNMQDLAENHHQKLLELRHEIELVTLEQLIKKFESLLANKQQKEDRWQRLFQDNPFILNLAFGLPIMIVQDLVSMAGLKFDGTGEKIADFLYSNGITDNITLIEIKTPTTDLLGQKYRGGIFSPSTKLVGPVNQILDQRYHLQQNIAQLKINSRIYDLETYAIKCLVIIGTMPSDPDQKKSLELFRNNINDVIIVTFDELLEKLKNLYKFLSPKQE
jgi:hypothetical protein